jgi:hypothetical protein
VPIRVICPGCHQPLLLSDDLLGQKVCCQDCAQVFQAGEQPPSEDSGDSQAIEEPPRASFAFDESHEEPPRRSRVPDDDSEEDEERPQDREKPSGSLLPLVLVGVGVFLVLVLSGGGLTAWLLLSRKPAVQTAQTTQGPGKTTTQAAPEQDAQDEPQPKDEAKPVVPDSAPPLDLPSRPVGPGTVVTKGPNEGKAPAVTSPAGLGKVVRLPGTVGGVCVAGGGRYLVLALPAQRKLAVFDVPEGKLARYLDLASERFLFTAGQDSAVVLLTATNVLERWSLATGKREQFAPIAPTRAPRCLAMGAASSGPVLVGDTFHDLDRLRPLYIKPTGNGVDVFGDTDKVRVSADGTVFTAWKPGSSPQGVAALVLKGNQAQGYYDHDTAGQVVPGHDGKVIYTARGMYTSEVKPIGKAGRAGGDFCVPAVSGPFYLVLSSKSRFGFSLARGEKPEVALHMQGDARVLAKLTGLDLPDGINPWGRERVTIDQRLLFCPDHKVIVTVPSTDDRVVLYSFDVDQAMQKAGIDYLYVASHPPLQAEPGQTWSYEMAVRSRKGAVKVKLGSGPGGMTTTEDGKVTWAIPASFEAKEVNVVLNVTDASGQEVLHSFKVRVGDPTGTDDSPVPPKPVVLGEVAWDFPAPRPTLIQSPILTKARTSKLMTATVGDLVVGGGGRFVVLHFPREKRIGVFDVTSAKIVKYFAADDDDLLMAAGMDKLILVLPAAQKIERYSLSKLEREQSAPLPTKGRAMAVAMGPASAGPLLLWERGADKSTEKQKALYFLNPETFEVLASPGLDGVPGRIGAVRSIAASGDGRVFALRTPSRLYSLVRHGKRLVLYGSAGADFRAATYALPGPDGSVIYTSAGLFDERCRKLKDAKDDSNPLPASHGAFFLSDQGAYLRGYGRTVLKLPERTSLETTGLADTNPVPAEKRSILVPGARVLLFLTGSNDRLIVDRFDVVAALERSGIDYLYVTARPPGPVARGADFTYKLTAVSKRGKVKFRKVDGPAELKVGEDGTVTWKVPASKDEEEVAVKVSIEDSKQEINHTFTITVLAAPPAEDATKPPQP